MNVDEKLINAMCEMFRMCPYIEKAVLFGSRARGDTTERSDYDIAVYGDLPRDERARLRYDFDEALPTLHKIDLIFMQEQIASEFTDNIEKEGVEFYGKNHE